MGVKKAIGLKTALEAGIYNLIDEYERDTGLIVNCVDICRGCRISTERPNVLRSVRVGVVLE